MPSESTRKLDDLTNELIDKYVAIPAEAKQTAYAKFLFRLIGQVAREADMSKQMDEAKSYARCS